jgi:hypothetical protein
VYCCEEIYQKKMSNNVQIIQAAAACLGSGGFFNPETRKENFHKFATDDVVLEVRFPAPGAPYEKDVSQLYHGEEGWYAHFGFMFHFEMKDLQQSTIAGFTPDTVLHKQTYIPVARNTGKASDTPMSQIVEFSLRDGKISKLVMYFSNVNTLNSLFV